MADRPEQRTPTINRQLGALLADSELAIGRRLFLRLDDPTGFVESLEGRVILDEVQRVPALFRALKRSVDRDRQLALAIHRRQEMLHAGIVLYDGERVPSFGGGLHAMPISASRGTAAGKAGLTATLKEEEVA
jgi:hypothetical protein